MDLAKFWKEGHAKINPVPTAFFSGPVGPVPLTDAWTSMIYMTHRAAASEPTDRPGVVKYNDGTGLAYYQVPVAWEIMGIKTQEEFNTAFHEDLIVVVPRLHGSKRVREVVTDACSLHELAAARFPGTTSEKVFGSHIFCYCKYYRTIHTLPPT